MLPEWYTKLITGQDLVNRLVLLVRELGFESNEIPSNPLFRFDFLLGLLLGEWKSLFVKMIQKANESDDFKKRRQMGELFVEAIKF
ncbi:MAG: hypothetical protein HC932_02355 [Thermales bacterium]|nr:hypothetical protein [Thermales bacterium]